MRRIMIALMVVAGLWASASPASARHHHRHGHHSRHVRHHARHHRHRAHSRHRFHHESYRHRSHRRSTHRSHGRHAYRFHYARHHPSRVERHRAHAHFTTHTTAGGGMASWYHARGERHGEMTAAHPYYPLGTRVQVTSATTGRSVVVRITGRGPFVRGRVIDLSHGAARAMGMGGVDRVRLRRL